MTNRPSQRGAATLLVTLVLFLALALVVLGLHRALALEQRGATNRVRATQAFEAAEAGLAWAQAQLNSVQRIGPDCAPSTEPGATTFRERYLSIDRASGVVTPTAAQPGCVRGASGWTCRCPASGAAGLAAPGGTEFAPAFTLSLQPVARAGLLRVVANGCTSAAGACAASSATTVSASADASARNEVALGLFAGLRHAPVAAVTTRAPAQTPEQFFAAHFGIDAPTWRGQSVVARLTCTSDCATALGDAAAAGHALLWIDGDLTLTGPFALGSLARPVVIVASGAVRLTGPGTIVGVVHGASVDLGSANVRGAVLSASSGDTSAATAGAVLDTEVLAALSRQTGSFARVAGSWRDFF